MGKSDYSKLKNPYPVISNVIIFGNRSPVSSLMLKEGL